MGIYEPASFNENLLTILYENSINIFKENVESL